MTPTSLLVSVDEESTLLKSLALPVAVHRHSQFVSRANGARQRHEQLGTQGLVGMLSRSNLIGFLPNILYVVCAGSQLRQGRDCVADDCIFILGVVAIGEPSEITSRIPLIQSVLQYT